MKIAIITDQHFGVREDKASILNNFEKFYENVFFPIIDKEGVEVVLDLGDTFDKRRSGNYQTIDRAMKMFFDPMEARSLPYHVIVGNHTAYYKNTNSVGSMQILMNERPNVNLYSDEPVELEFDGLKVMMVPWLTRTNRRTSLEAINNSNAHFLMGHFELNGFEMQKGYFCDRGLDPKLFSKFETVYSGHFHIPSEKDNIKYLGAPYEMN